MSANLQELIVTKGLPLVQRLAKRHERRNNVGLDESELFSLGQSKLVEVAPEYNPTPLTGPVKFTTYVFPYVNGAMQDAIRRKHFELNALELLWLAVDCASRRYSSLISDEVDGVAFEPPEVCAEHLHTDLSEMTLEHIATMAGAYLRRMQQGTEEHLGELDEYRLLAGVVARKVAELPAPVQRLWETHYVEERPLKEYAKEEGISEATAGRYHRELKDTLRPLLTPKG
jgi:RNA polymerase sigma factor (sigma-70 family)